MQEALAVVEPEEASPTPSPPVLLEAIAAEAPVKKSKVKKPKAPKLKYSRKTAAFRALLDKEDNTPERLVAIQRRLMCGCPVCIDHLKRAQMGLSLPKLIAPSKQHACTQKAKGLIALYDRNPFRDRGGFTFAQLPSFVVISEQGSQEEAAGCAQQMLSLSNHTPIVRPAPPQPDHGFIESEFLPLDGQYSPYSYTSPEAWSFISKKLQQAQAIYPTSEVIVMDSVDARSSAICIPESGLIVIGPGHDGATGGKGSISLPLVQGKLGPAKGRASVTPKQHGYLEMVYKDQFEPGFLYQYDYGARVVQLRGGPPASASVTNYIPKTTTISQVLIPSDDLVEWKKLTAMVKGIPGVVAWQKGGSLASHAAIHCTTNGIPFVTDLEQPKVGATIEPPPGPALVPFDRKEFSRGAAAARPPILGFSIQDFIEDDELSKVEVVTRTAVRLHAGISIIHNIVALQYSPHWSFLLGFASASLFRPAALACLGEYRHLHVSPFKGIGRAQVFAGHSDLSLFNLAEELAKITPQMLSSSFGTSYGGYPWFRSAVHAMRFYNTIAEGGPEQIIEAANDLLNCQHNGGWLFTKFTQRNFMDFAAKSPALAFASIAGLVYQGMTRDTACDNLDPRTQKLAPTLEITNFQRDCWGKNYSFTIRQGAIETHTKFLSPKLDTDAVMKEFFIHV